jgi:translation initiation factor IF-1
MSSEKRDRLEFDGVIIDHAHDIFRVEVKGSQNVIRAKLSGKMRMNKINLEVGDHVRVEVSPYDLSNGRIVFRHRQ